MRDHAGAALAEPRAGKLHIPVASGTRRAVTGWAQRSQRGRLWALRGGTGSSRWMFRVRDPLYVRSPSCRWFSPSRWVPICWVAVICSTIQLTLLPPRRSLPCERGLCVCHHARYVQPPRRTFHRTGAAALRASWRRIPVACNGGRALADHTVTARFHQGDLWPVTEPVTTIFGHCSSTAR